MNVLAILVCLLSREIIFAIIGSMFNENIIISIKFRKVISFFVFCVGKQRETQTLFSYLAHLINHRMSSNILPKPLLVVINEWIIVNCECTEWTSSNKDKSTWVRFHLIKNLISESLRRSDFQRLLRFYRRLLFLSLGVWNFSVYLTPSIYLVIIVLICWGQNF